MNRADEFVRLFNTLVDRLRKMTGQGHAAAFHELVAAAARTNPVVKRNVSLLRDYSELRNAIVHYHSYPAEYVAEPTEKTLARFGNLVDAIASRRKLYPAHRKDVRVFQADEKFTEALKYMDEMNFSQVVALKHGEHVLLTAEGIAEWLQTRVKGECLDLSTYTVGDVLEFEKGQKSTVMSRFQTIDEALELFSKTALGRRSTRIYAIIITHSGKRTEKPLGIVTAWDLLKDSRES